MKNLLRLFFLFSVLCTTHTALAQTYGRQNLYDLDNVLVIRTPDSIQHVHPRLIKLLEENGYKTVYSDFKKYSRNFRLSVARVASEVPEYEAQITFYFYKRREGTCLNIVGTCYGAGVLNGRSIFYVDETNKNKKAPAVRALWRELYHAAMLYPGGTLTYSHDRPN